MVVVLLLAVIWAAVFVPPALRAQALRREAFLVSFDPAAAPEERVETPARRRSHQVQRRRRIAGGLLLAMAATGLGGLLPTFRVLLVVHLFLLDSFLAYVALLAHMANRQARAQTSPLAEPVVVPTAPVVADEPAPLPRRIRRRPAILPDLPPIAPAG